MKKYTRTILAILIATIIFGCNSNQDKLSNAPERQNNEKSIIGLYSYVVTGYNSHCEIVKHTLLLKEDSTFVLKVYCDHDSTSPLKPVVKVGKWKRQEDSLFSFAGTDTTFQLKLIDDTTVQIVPKNNELFNLPFQKDTSRNE